MKIHIANASIFPMCWVVPLFPPCSLATIMFVPLLSAKSLGHTCSFCLILNKGTIMFSRARCLFKLFMEHALFQQYHSYLISQEGFLTYIREIIPSIVTTSVLSTIRPSSNHFMTVNARALPTVRSDSADTSLCTIVCYGQAKPGMAPYSTQSVADTVQWYCRIMVNHALSSSPHYGPSYHIVCTDIPLLRATFPE